MERHATLDANIALLRTNHTWDDGAQTGRWIRDLDRIFSNLHVITNNGPDSIGGSCERLQPLAPRSYSAFPDYLINSGIPRGGNLGMGCASLVVSRAHGFSRGVDRDVT
jgi:hypothetical protein